MAPTTAPYDPSKSLEGMWNGSLSRLGYYFKDPASYGQQTQTVLRRTAKRYQDALDDCEIQILEAKWYLEHQLALNRARREQQASESAHTANKRKLDSVNDEQPGDVEREEENPAKRVKIQDTKDSETLVAEGTIAQVEDAAKAGNNDSQNTNGDNEPPSNSANATIATSQEAAIQKETVESHGAKVIAPKKPPEITTAKVANNISIDFAPQEDPKTSGPATSIDENQNFNFDSMFDDPNDGGDGTNADLGFDMDLGADPFASVINDANNSGQADKSASLDSLLPGLETYANQTGDDMMMNFTSNGAGGAGMDGTAGGSSNPFDLPDLGDSTFDDLLNDESLGGNMAGTGDDMLNDDSMMNLGEFDDSFFN